MRASANNYELVPGVCGLFGETQYRCLRCQYGDVMSFVVLFNRNGILFHVQLFLLQYLIRRRDCDCETIMNTFFVWSGFDAIVRGPSEAFSPDFKLISLSLCHR